MKLPKKYRNYEVLTLEEACKHKLERLVLYSPHGFLGEKVTFMDVILHDIDLKTRQIFVKKAGVEQYFERYYGVDCLLLRPNRVSKVQKLCENVVVEAENYIERACFNGK